MNELYLRLTAQDPLVARDGRPFGAGSGTRMKSLAWLSPSVVAGSFRTAWAKHNEIENQTFNDALVKKLKAFEIAGVFPMVADELYLPCPNDVVLVPNKDECQPATAVAAKPYSNWPSDGAGCDLPHGIKPVILSPGDAPDDFKPESLPKWWPMWAMTQWLLENEVSFLNNSENRYPFLDSPHLEERDHVEIEPGSGAAKDGRLFTTAALNLTQMKRYKQKMPSPTKKVECKLNEVKKELPIPESPFVNIDLATRVRGTGGQPIDYLHPLGGERRLVRWHQEATGANPWGCPADLAAKLKGAPRVRMVLVSPGIFQHGWQPGWLKLEGKEVKYLEGTPPMPNAKAGPKLRLVGVCNERWKAISGWSYEKNKVGPKAIRRMVPAGAVYFFEVLENREHLPELWLESVCDDEQDRRDGFGLAVWGTWQLGEVKSANK
ncbi:type III-B CRISPR module-associated Cmr3 family protein [Tuwongella immobilis]|uniref:CRISPR-associated protein Cmr3 n=1 Tax=Tuwongella immobilis TaxID=692036 RepID=A0A6C2YKY0_9BACT|nr:type III-B CRISPR module-associated Cmr3 family protein [Tuwongella immobilis]VIP02238.1 CRISPR-associated protein, Cmr3 family OS=Teredinibacter turnerae (strain ATCC 39867 / T7901) GN=cmr3 PE=4 SV=1: Cas_Cmr3 [Tuwongella immobilis]VTS00801.1 CRISPR-associated protein, Cmr3 family OS=Teredinibacter turnerae (strain ATCC 39867 / T7901) GN=cmr3 PE=4 SV=1: Cas_Cmr3 [Tuwongella immobilis]